MTKKELIILLKEYKENSAKLKKKRKYLYVLRQKIKEVEDIETTLTTKYRN